MQVKEELVRNWKRKCNVVPNHPCKRLFACVFVLGRYPTLGVSEISRGGAGRGLASLLSYTKALKKIKNLQPLGREVFIPVTK